MRVRNSYINVWSLDGDIASAQYMVHAFHVFSRHFLSNNSYIIYISILNNRDFFIKNK